MSEQHINDRVESFFLNVEKGPKQREPRLINEFTTAARMELENAHQELGDEGYNKFSALIANDERINAHLPGLAIIALSPQTNMFNRFVDRDKSDSVSKSEIEAASSDSSKFDPIHQKALRYAADNFDKLRALAPKDGAFIGNNSDVTTADIYAAKQNFSDHVHRQNAIKDMRLVLENFDAIDDNSSGKITLSETKKWSGERGVTLSKYALPLTNGKMIGGSEELTKEDYGSRLTEHERRLRDISSQLGLK